MTRFREFCIFFFLARINPTNREIPHARNRTQNAPEQINNSRRQCKQTNNSKLLRKITTIGTDTNRALEISARETTTISGPIRLVATSLTTSSPPSVCQLLWFCLRLCGCGCAISARAVCASRSGPWRLSGFVLTAGLRVVVCVRDRARSAGLFTFRRG